MPQFARFKGAQPAVTAMSKEKHKNDFCMCGVASMWRMNLRIVSVKLPLLTARPPVFWNPEDQTDQS